MARQIDFLLAGLEAANIALSGGTATIYATGTTDLSTVYSDQAGTTPAANPIALNTRGAAERYMNDGVYDAVIKNAAGSTIDTLTFIIGPAAGEVVTTSMADNVVTLAKMEHGTQGDILYYGASGVPARLPASTSGHVLTTKNAGANPAWEALPTSTDSVAGVIELATTAEVQTGTDSTRAMTTNAFRQGGKINGTLTASTSGTSIPFTGIPSWVKRIVVMLNGVSLSGTDELQLQIGDAGGLETSGYAGGSAYVTSAAQGTVAASSAFTVTAGSGAAGATFHGQATLTLMDSATNLWAYSCTVARSDTGSHTYGAGTKALSATLTQLAVIPSGSNTFDAGSINIMYE